MRVPLVAGNWKMNGSLETIGPLIEGVQKGMASIKHTEIAVFPPFIYLPNVSERLANSSIKLGAQDLSNHDNGAFTGEISATMLTDYNCYYVIVGHSERRHIYHENDNLVTHKFAKAKASGLIPILCVGETLEEREANLTKAVVERQLQAILAEHPASVFNDAIIAYEPVWAIGTGRTATPDQAQDVHETIRAVLARQDSQAAKEARILYGGSVKAGNAAELFEMPDIDGGLIGGASLDIDDFLSISQAAD